MTFQIPNITLDPLLLKGLQQSTPLTNLSELLEVGKILNVEVRLNLQTGEKGLAVLGGWFNWEYYWTKNIAVVR